MLTPDQLKPLADPASGLGPDNPDPAREPKDLVSPDPEPEASPHPAPAPSL